MEEAERLFVRIRYTVPLVIAESILLLTRQVGAKLAERVANIRQSNVV